MIEYYTLDGLKKQKIKAQLGPGRAHSDSDSYSKLIITYSKYKSIILIYIIHIA